MDQDRAHFTSPHTPKGTDKNLSTRPLTKNTAINIAAEDPMVSFRDLKGIAMKQFRAGRQWLGNKLRRRRPEIQEERKIVIGAPTDFRREAITLGTDVNGNAVLIEQAREDAQTMHHRASQSKLKAAGNPV